MNNITELSHLPLANEEKPEIAGIGKSELEILDTLPQIAEGEVSPQTLTDIFTDLSHEGMMMADKVANNTDQPPDLPTNFTEMLDTSVGSYWQRAAKAWIKPRDSEGTIKLLEALQVDEFLKISLLLYKLLHKDAHRKNYHLRDEGMASMIDFATNQTTLNEVVHLASLPLSALYIAVFINTGQMPWLVAANLATLAINTYLVLGQRYTRARLSRVINKVLSKNKKNKKFDLSNYSNKLGLVLEKKIDDRE